MTNSHAQELKELFIKQPMNVSRQLRDKTKVKNECEIMCDQAGEKKKEKQKRKKPRALQVYNSSFSYSWKLCVARIQKTKVDISSSNVYIQKESILGTHYFQNYFIYSPKSMQAALCFTVSKVPFPFCPQNVWSTDLYTTNWISYKFQQSSEITPMGNTYQNVLKIPFKALYCSSEVKSCL